MITATVDGTTVVQAETGSFEILDTRKAIKAQLEYTAE